ncbi:hypothetical protein [Trichlorobacter lovleyi]|uniref:Uncharacterized protein n=1 Tax=Trichlorobacter lovleyi (strain ATCC BAA-1151 / DSM 17278 / SZ) TaxID=398767 RepID=B3E504_TRIL1|nr:hypothetical protein [Trichlorobacter lovleyi]ACD94569.1 hypothetical protein Glov_0845 [Trichlorobacter lovleyi SZ]
MPVSDQIELARLRITPSCGFMPLSVHLLKLVQRGDAYHIQVTEQQGPSRKRWRVTVPADEVTQQLDLLRRATLPAFPVSPLVCDGEYVELTIHGEFSDLTLGWWTIAPDGAESLSDFADWMRKLALPDEEESDDE